MSELMKKLGALYELQMIESEMMESLREIRRLDKSVSPIAVKHRKLTAQIEAVEIEAKPVHGEIKRLQDEAALHNEKKKEVEDKLFTAGVDPKELQFLKMKRDELAALIKKHEDQVVKMSERIAGADIKKREVETQLAEIDAAYRKEKKDADEKRDRLAARIEELKKKRLEFRDFKDRDLLARYQRLQKQNDGIAIVTISDGVCDGCFVEVSKATATHLRTAEDLVTCQRCGRIIYCADTA